MYHYKTDGWTYVFDNRSVLFMWTVIIRQRLDITLCKIANEIITKENKTEKM